MINPSVVITSSLLWKSALVTALIDIPLLILAAIFVSSDLFHKLKWHLAGAAAVIYAALYGVFAAWIFWDSVYRLVFPAWFRYLLPVCFALLGAALALLFWWLSNHASRMQVIGFILLGGAFSLLGHGLGISRGLMHVPMLAGASAISALTFGVFEFIFYWSIIVGLAAAARWLCLTLKASLKPPAGTSTSIRQK